MNHRRHKDGHMVIAVGSEYSPADLINRGFLPDDPPFHLWNGDDFHKAEMARIRAEVFDAKNEGES